MVFTSFSRLFPPLSLSRLLVLSFFSRLLVLSLGSLGASIGQHKSPDAVPSQSLLPHRMLCSSSPLFSLLEPFGHWDSYHFLDIALNEYNKLYLFAFFPLYPHTLKYIVEYVITMPSFSSICPYSLYLLVGVFLNIFLFPLIVFLLHALTSSAVDFFPSPARRFLAYQSTLLFIFNPASIFFTALYTESLYTFLSVLALALLQGQPYKAPRLIMASIVFGFASATRSTGVLNSIFIAYHGALIAWPLIVRLTQTGRDEEEKMNIFARLFGLVFIIATCLFFVLSPSYFFQRWSIRHWAAISPTPVDERDYYTMGGLVPTIYAQIQKKYWAVEFLGSYSIRQLPNFLLATPVLVVSGLILKNYWLGMWRNREEARKSAAALFPIGSSTASALPAFVSALFKKAAPHDAAPPNFLFRPCFLPHIVHCSILWLFALTFLNIQVATRFLLTQPIMYWGIAAAFQQRSSREKSQEENKQPPAASAGPARSSGAKRASSYGDYFLSPDFIFTWFIGYFCLGAFMFCTFLPWT